MNILNRKAYADVDIPAGLVDVAANHVPLKKAQAERRTREIRRFYEQGFSQVEIAKKVGCGTATVCRALKGYKE
jgi:DNA invertase Pin-like site-specific DNA recombinase